MNDDHLVMAFRLLASVVAGGLIGFERSFRGRPAGFRTHTLVCLASTVLMLVTVYEWQWVQARTPETIRLDPTRMAQGIMTGIGFLGAGVIFKEALSVRGLTTAASIWITAAIGILIGIGFYYPAALTTVLVLFVLSMFQFIESRMPVQNYARLDLVFPRGAVIEEAELLAELRAEGFSVAQLEYRQTEHGKRFGYRMMIKSAKPQRFSDLARKLRDNRSIEEFRISPAGD
jgi:putative Mg2+ transporter-C (MgtC) family protein